MSTLRLLLSDSTDPWFNLAVEECIFRQMPATQRVLFLWRNADTVVIGRAQTRGKSATPAGWRRTTCVRLPQQRRRRGIPRSRQYLLYSSWRVNPSTMSVSTRIVLAALARWRRG